MKRSVIRLLLVVVLLVTALPGLTAAAQEGTITIESQPEAAALYQGDLAYLRDTVTVPAGMDAVIVLPRTTVSDSLILLEDGSRVRNYRYQEAGESGALAVRLAADEDAARTVTLTYLASGAGWRPVYDMDVLAPDSVQFGFDAIIRNHALRLEDVDLRLVAGMPGADAGRQPQMSVTQMNTLYEQADQPAGSIAGAVAINHVYDIGVQTIMRGEALRWNLFYDGLDARRLLVWDARFGQRVDVIYKVRNDSDVPFVAGLVTAYEDGLYVGQDQIEWTPVSGEGSLTIGGLSTIRVRRTESVEDIGTRGDSRYLHDVQFEITNHGSEDIDLTVLDEWNRSGQDFVFSMEPQRQGNNVLRWEVPVPAGETATITVSFIVD